MKARCLISVIFIFVSVYLFANDGVYYTSGNMLVPMRESTIEVRKEILTITIGKERRAMVDVYYEFYNPDSTKSVAMAFEAAAPYNAEFDISKSIEHPYIHDFKVVMNEQVLGYKNMLIVSRWEEGEKVIGNEITPIDMKEWTHKMPEKYSEYDMPEVMYNARLDSIIFVDYGYLFEATFKPGVNIVHHTYSYDMSYNVAARYSVAYWLTPATRWANGKIEDFTLRIKNENSMDYLISNDSVFAGSEFRFSEGFGDIYPLTDECGGHNTMVVAQGGDAVLEWHARDFAPKTDLILYSVDYVMPWMSPYMGIRESKVVVTADGMAYRYIGVSVENYLVEGQDFGLIKISDAKVETYSAEKSQGILTIKGKSAKVRKEASGKSGVVKTVKDKRGELPVVMKCQGMTEDRDDEGYYWYKVEVEGKTGYVREDMVKWDAVDTY